MNKINVCFMRDEVVDTLHEHAKLVTQKIKENPTNINWLKEIYNGDIFEIKKHQIPEFNLITSADGDYSKVDFINSITLYEALKDLPRFVLTDERFWAWINFTVGYEASIQAMEFKTPESTFRDHWLFGQGKRRGLFFGVLSRCYFRVELSVDESLGDNKYELTKFVIENPERFRNLTWRANSNIKSLVVNILKAEKAICDKYGNQVKSNIYKELAKHISLYGSVRLIDAVSEEEIYNFVYNKMEEMINA